MSPFPRILATAAALVLAQAVQAGDKVTYDEQILPLLKNACLNCHNPDKKKAGLDLSSYQAALAGSDNGKVLVSGDPGASLLFKCVRQTEDPKMPPKGDKLSDSNIALLEKWIAGQLLESNSSKAVAAGNQVQLAAVSLQRPPGPPPLPARDLPLEPLVHTPTSNALVALAASPWAPLVAVGGQQQIVLYHTETLRPLGILPFPEGFPAVLRFSQNGQVLLAGGGLGGKSGAVVLWKIATGERIGQVGHEFDQVLAADLSPDQGAVALGGPAKLLKIYATKDGKLLQTIKKHTNWITAIAYSPDGQYLASADRNGAIEVWEGATGQPLVSLPGHKAMVTALAFLPGVLASAGEDGKIMLWDVKEGKQIRTWTAHSGGVLSVNFSPEGRLVSAGRDRCVKAWDQAGKALMTAEPFPEIALRAVLAGDRVVGGDWAGNIRVFKAADGQRLGSLTANPASIAENLKAARQHAQDCQNQAAAAREAITQGETARQKELEDLARRHAAAMASAEAALRRAQANRAAKRALPEAMAKELAAEQETLVTLTTVAEAQPEAERESAQSQVQTQTQRVAQTQAALEKARADLASSTEAARQKEEQLSASWQKILEEPAKLPPSPEAVKQAAAAAKVLEAAQAEQDRLAAEVAKAKAAGQDAKASQAALENQKLKVAAAGHDLQTAQERAASSPVEQEIARQRALLAEAEAALPTAADDMQYWDRAAAFLAVHRAEQEVLRLGHAEEASLAAAKAAAEPIEQARAEAAEAEQASSAAAAAAQEAQAVAKRLPRKLAEARAALAALPADTASSRETKQDEVLRWAGKAGRATENLALTRQTAERAQKALQQAQSHLAAVSRDTEHPRSETEQAAAQATRDSKAAQALAESLRLDFSQRYPPAAAPLAAQ